MSKDADFNRAAMLLHIVDTSKQWPNLKGIHDLAMKELEAMSLDARQQLLDFAAEEKVKADEVAQKKEAERIEKAAEEGKSGVAAQAAPLFPQDQPIIPDNERRV